MTISEASWMKYIDDLSKINQTAAQKMEEFMHLNRDADGFWNSQEIRQLIIDYAFGLSEKYGNAAAELACEMYDSVGALSGISLPAAEPAATATYSETAKAVNGALKISDNEKLVINAVDRLIKLAGVDTTLKNAIRDHAEWAWVPHGDTCAFCIALASRGWQDADSAILNGIHAEHVHANCDCTFAIRHNSNTEYAGYDPSKYKRIYDNASGRSSYEKINSIERSIYNENREEINARKRAEYAARKEREAAQ